MSKEEKNKVLPSLRFTEFMDSGVWEEKTLGELANVLMCKRIFAEETTENYAVPFFKIGTLGRIPDAFISKELFDLYKSKYNYPRKGEILITCSGTIGKCLIYNGEDAYYQDSNIVWIDNPSLEISNELLYYLLSRINWGKLNSTTITRIYGADLRSLHLLFPSQPAEQQKIADCLSSLDEYITAESQQLEALKAHKKGLMQQLFPAEGETVPQLRFAEFRDSGEWDVDVLSGESIAEFISERMPFQELMLEKYVSTENLLSDYGGVTLSSKLPAAGSFTRFKKEDVLVSNIRPYLKKVWFANRDGGASNDVMVLRAGLNINATFLSYLLKNDDFINYIMKGAEGVKMPRGDKDLIKEYPIAFPKKEEQQKIAKCLSSLDELIAARAAKIEALKLHKKGLMQGLFPSSEL